jgi:3-oxoadipate enol-lactonase
VRDLGGDGRPLVLWPSLFSDHRLYSRLTPLIRPLWRVILFDGPGFGDSDPPGDRIQPEHYAAAVTEILDALNIERAVFAGTSWGGQIGAHLAASHANRTAAVLMMNTPLAPSMGGHILEVWAARLLGRTNFYADGVARSMLSPRARADSKLLKSFTSPFSDFNPRGAAITATTTLRQFAGLASVLPGVQVPMTILLGSLDRLYPVDSLLPIARLAPDARIIVQNECAHLAPLETPQAVADALVDLRQRAP